MDNKFLAIIDVQPNFQRSCHKLLPAIIEKINNTDQNIICFFVGKELDGDSKSDVMAYFLENGVDMDKLDRMRFIEKDFGFFRPWMDAGVADELIINAIKYLKSEGVSDTSQLKDNDWEKLLSLEERKNFSLYDEPIFYPGFKSSLLELKEVDGIELIGGALHECLTEINLYLKSLDKKTYINTSLCYGKEPINKMKLR